MPAIINRPTSGSMVWLFVNGSPWGNVTSLDLRMSNNSRRRMEIDSNTTAEIVPGPYTVSGSMNVYRLLNDGGAEGRDIMASQQYSSRQRYVRIRLVNRLTQEVIFESLYTRFIDQKWSYRTKSLAQGTLAFECLNWSSGGTKHQDQDSTIPNDEKIRKKTLSDLF